MQKPVLFGIIGLILGLVVGFFGANTLNRSTASSSAPPLSNAAIANLTGPQVPGQPAAQPGRMIPDVAEAIEKAKNEPQNVEAQLKVGEMYWKINKFDKAAEFYQKAVEIKPEDFDLNVKLANAYFESKQFESAEKFYSKALEIKPSDIDARTDLGTTFVERQTPDLERGMQEFQKVLDQNPKHEPTLYNMAVIYSKRGDTENVKKMLAKLEEIDPNSRYVAQLKKITTEK